MQTCDNCGDNLTGKEGSITVGLYRFCTLGCFQYFKNPPVNVDAGQLIQNNTSKTKVTNDSIRLACNELAEILIAKNEDYGNSVEEQYNEYGEMSLNLRLEDKLRRLKNLTNKKANVNEKKAETWIDAAGYSVLAYILMKDE
jgi:hypothetical protein